MSAPKCKPHQKTRWLFFLLLLLKDAVFFFHWDQPGVFKRNSLVALFPLFTTHKQIPSTSSSLICWAGHVFGVKSLVCTIQGGKYLSLLTYLWPGCHSLSLSPSLCPVDPCSECRDNVITMRHGAGSDSTAQRASVPIELQTRGQRGYSLALLVQGVEAELESHQGVFGTMPWMQATWAGCYGWPNRCDTKAMALGRKSYRLYVFGVRGLHLCGCQQGPLNKRWLKRRNVREVKVTQADVNRKTPVHNFLMSPFDVSYLHNKKKKHKCWISETIPNRLPMDKVEHLSTNIKVSTSLQGLGLFLSLSSCVFATETWCSIYSCGMST